MNFQKIALTCTFAVGANLIVEQVYASSLIDNTITSDNLWKTSGDCTHTATNLYQLTPSTANTQGTLCSEIAIDFTKAFSWSYQIYCGSTANENSWVSVSFHNDPSKTSNFDYSNGASNGVQTFYTCYWDFGNGVAIGGNDGSKYTPIIGGEIFYPSPSLTNGNWKNAALVWNPMTLTLKHYFADSGSTTQGTLNPATLITAANLKHTINFGSYAATYLGGE